MKMLGEIKFLEIDQRITEIINFFRTAILQGEYFRVYATDTRRLFNRVLVSLKVNGSHFSREIKYQQVLILKKLGISEIVEWD